MSVERCCSVLIKTWRLKKFNSKKAVIVSCVIVVFFVCFNIDFSFDMAWIEAMPPFNSSYCSPSIYSINKSKVRLSIIKYILKNALAH